MTVAMKMEGWIKATPFKEHQTRRTLRKRACNPPRLTTKIQNQKEKKR